MHLILLTVVAEWPGVIIALIITKQKQNHLKIAGVLKEFNRDVFLEYQESQIVFNRDFFLDYLYNFIRISQTNRDIFLDKNILKLLARSYQIK